MRQLLPGWIATLLPYVITWSGKTPARCGLNLLTLYTSSRILLDISVHCESQMGVFFPFRSFDAKTFQTEVTFLPAIVPHDVEFLLVLVSYFHFVDISWFLLGVKLGSSWGGWGWLRVEKSTFRKARLVVVLSNQFLFHSLPSVHFSCTNWNLAEKVKGRKKKSDVDRSFATCQPFCTFIC